MGREWLVGMLGSMVDTFFVKGESPLGVDLVAEIGILTQFPRANRTTERVELISRVLGRLLKKLSLTVKTSLR